MLIYPVLHHKDMKVFLSIPRLLHGSHPCYIPPLMRDEKGIYHAKTNPILKHGGYGLFILLDDHQTPVGRIMAYVDAAYNSHYASNTGFFAAFECIENGDAAGLLINAAEKWLKDRGVSDILGPIQPVAENWGFVLEGGDIPPVFLSPWNPPYYHSFFLDAGYGKAKDLLVYEADIEKGYRLPGRYMDIMETFGRRYPGIRIRRLDRRNIKRDARAIWEISNTALSGNWGYVPLDLSVMEDMLKKLKPVVDPDAVWMVEDEGVAVGFCLGFPDINIILKKINGRLFPLGWFSLLTGARRLRDYRLFGLAVHPRWQSKGLDAMMYVNLYNHLRHKRVRMEANYILEDNFHIRNALEKLGMIHIKTYRIYSKPLPSGMKE
jgi:GNAT superfamily N-acetyltransferase